MSGQFFHLWNKLLKLCNLCLPISSDHRESWVIFLTRKQRAWGSDYSLPLHTYLSGSKESPVRPAHPTPGACPAPGISSAPGNGWKGCWWGPRLHAPARGWKEDPLFPQRHLCLWPWGLLCLCLVGFSLLLVCLFAFFQKSGIFPAPSSFWEKIQVDHVPTSPVPISLVLSLQNSPLSQNHKEKKKKVTNLVCFGLSWVTLRMSQAGGSPNLESLSSSRNPNGGAPLLLQTWLLLVSRAEWPDRSTPSEWLRGHTAPSLWAQHDARWVIFVKTSVFWPQSAFHAESPCECIPFLGNCRGVWEDALPSLGPQCCHCTRCCSEGHKL